MPVRFQGVTKIFILSITTSTKVLLWMLVVLAQWECFWSYKNCATQGCKEELSGQVQLESHKIGIIKLFFAVSSTIRLME